MLVPQQGNQDSLIALNQFSAVAPRDSLLCSPSQLNKQAFFSAFMFFIGLKYSTIHRGVFFKKHFYHTEAFLVEVELDGLPWESTITLNVNKIWVLNDRIDDFSLVTPNFISKDGVEEGGYWNE